MDTIKQTWNELMAVLRKPRHATQQALNLGCIVFSALMLWKLLMLTTGSRSPVVVVLSGSMEPGFHRGDILFLTNPSKIYAGDVVVFEVDGRDIPIVHRAMSIHVEYGIIPRCSKLHDSRYDRSNGEFSLLTKGDNNQVDDRGLYAKNQLWLSKSNIMGVAQGFLPYAGMVTIWLNDYVWLKYLTIGMMALLVMLGKD